MRHIGKTITSCPVAEEFRHASTAKFEALHYSERLPSLKTFEAFYLLATSVYGVSYDVSMDFMNVNWRDINIVTFLPNVEFIGNLDKKTYSNLVGFRNLCADILENKTDTARVHLMHANPMDEIPCICCDISDLQDLMFNLVDIAQPDNQDELYEIIGAAKALTERTSLAQDNRDFRMC